MGEQTTRVRRFRPEQQPEDVVPCLEIITGKRGGERLQLEPGKSRIGRAANLEIALDEDGVSRVHAELLVDEHGIATLVDRDSTNGTFVNGARITRIALREGDRVNVGSQVQLRFVYRLPGELRGEPASPAGTSELSTRELEVAELAAQGYSNDGVAAHLGISARTVGKHLSNIYAKLGIHTRAELTRWVLMRGKIATQRDLLRPSVDRNMKRVIQGALLVTTMACGATGAPSAVRAPEVKPAQPVSFAPRETVLPWPEGMLPAGIYFRSHTYQPCNSFEDGEARGLCTTPTVAVIAKGVHDLKGAREALPAIAAAPHATGYPVVAHSDELMMDDPRHGVVIVVGFFADDAAARSWRGVLQGSLPTEVVRLMPENGEVKTVATRISPLGSATVYRGKVIEEEGLPPLRVPPAEDSLEAICELAAGTVVTSDRETMQMGYYEWLPVTCEDGTAGYVHWKETLMHATVTRVPGESTFEMVRLGGAMCDSPFFETHAWEGDAPGALIAGDPGGVAPC